MVGQSDHTAEQARIMPISENNKSYGNSRESKNHGYPPFLGGIGIEIPSLCALPYLGESKFFSSTFVPEIFHVENSIGIPIPENFICRGLGGNFVY